jgi:hypothetical protein
MFITIFKTNYVKDLFIISRIEPLENLRSLVEIVGN